MADSLKEDHLQPKPAARILLADDSEIVRGMLKCLLLQLDPSWEVFEAGNARAALEKTRDLQPEVAMLDLNLPDMSGQDAAVQMRQISPATKIILCSLREASHLAAMAQSMGADGYFSKTASPEELHKTILAILM